MGNNNCYNDYLESLKEIYGKLDNDATEISGRSALENLLNAVAKTIGKSYTVTQEPASIDGAAPDFKIEQDSIIIGYLENKRPNIDLDEVIESDQIKRYQKLNKNIMLTNYHEWIWTNNNNKLKIVQLFKLDDLKNPHFRLKPKEIEKLDSLLFKFLETKPEPIKDVSEFAQALAVRTRYLNEYMVKSLEQYRKGKLQRLYETLKEQLYPQLEIAEFADNYSQMLAYGLFLARLNSEKDIDLQNAELSIPRIFGLMRELVSFLQELDEPQYKEIKWVVEEILFIINYMDRVAIADSLSFNFRPDRSLFKGKDKLEFEMFSSDPFACFYENFLTAYNQGLRKSRGVYYTPPPIVNFIVRSLDDILKDIFEIPAGFVDHQKVTVLDFACGTGTFMLEIFQQVLDSIGAKDANWGKATPVIREHLLKNIYGFELLIAAYTIAHLKLWQYLTDKGYQFQEDERLQIYLTNTLKQPKKLEDERKSEREYFPEALIAESKLGEKIKDKKFLVITGNPPYSANSQNPSRIDGKLTWIGELMKDYKTINGHSINERNSKWLQDDYVKFIRYAQHKMQEVDEGVVGIITNHGFIDNPTFRAMRHSLMQTFDQIYIIDLHGNVRKKERARDGGKDENVFDIQQGVAISFFIKKKGLEKGVFYSDILGVRQKKYQWALENNFNSVNWKKLKPNDSNYLFIPQDTRLKPEYDEGWSVTDIFKINSVGVTTARDELTIQFSKKEIQDVVNKFASLSTKEAREKFNLREDSSDWKVASAQEDIKKHKQDDEMFYPILYRPFDKRFTYYSGKAGGFICRPRRNIMNHMLKDNLALITVRQNSTIEFNKVFIADSIVESGATGGGVSYVFPLYIFERYRKYSNIDKSASSRDLQKNKKQENFQKEFRSFINKKYNHEFSPEEIIAYIYAILHSSTYRSRYKEFLRQEYPQIPFCDNKKYFENLAKIGQELIGLHLMHASQPNINLWKGKGDNFEVEKIFFNEKTESLYINEYKFLQPIPKKVWEFDIGGYRVLDRYLKNRKDRNLNSDEITYIENIVYTIEKTLSIMENLDSLIHKAFPQFFR